jgi:hypothetical protein
MSKQVITVLTDDLDGGDADRTVEFGLDGVTYTIDLSDKNAGKLRKALDPYLAVAARAGRNSGQSRPGSRRSVAAPAGRVGREQNQAIREERLRGLRTRTHPQHGRRSVPQSAMSTPRRQRHAGRRSPLTTIADC